MINLDEHKIYIESYKMEMVPLSIAVQAVQEALTPETEKYTNELENALNELRSSLNNINLDD